MPRLAATPSKDRIDGNVLGVQTDDPQVETQKLAALDRGVGSRGEVDTRVDASHVVSRPVGLAVEASGADPEVRPQGGLPLVVAQQLEGRRDLDLGRPAEPSEQLVMDIGPK